MGQLFYLAKDLKIIKVPDRDRIPFYQHGPNNRKTLERQAAFVTREPKSVLVGEMPNCWRSCRQKWA